MEIIYGRERATAGEVLNALSGEPHLSTVRTQLHVLEEKGYLKHKDVGRQYRLFPRDAAEQGQTIRAETNHGPLFQRLREADDGCPARHFHG